MAKNKYTLMTIITLLVIFVPAAIYGTITHILTNNNINHDYKYGNKLYFYENDKELGTYTCVNNGCDYTNYSNGEKSTIINSRYAFINDNKVVNLYDIKEKRVIDTYSSVDFLDSYYLVEKDNLFGVLIISDFIDTVLDCRYKEINYKDGIFAVLEDASYKLIKNSEELYSSASRIIDFSENYVVLKNNDTVSINDFNNKSYFVGETPNEDAYIVDNYFVIKRKESYLVYKLESGSEVLLDSFTYKGDVRLTFNVSDTEINIYTAGELQKTIELNQ